MKIPKIKEDESLAMWRERWEQACNGYLCELLRMWELDAYYCYWPNLRSWCRGCPRTPKETFDHL